jgi:hypothetical protein
MKCFIGHVRNVHCPSNHEWLAPLASIKTSSENSEGLRVDVNRLRINTMLTSRGGALNSQF